MFCKYCQDKVNTFSKNIFSSFQTVRSMGLTEIITSTVAVITSPETTTIVADTTTLTTLAVVTPPPTTTPTTSITTTTEISKNTSIVLFMSCPR